MRSKNFEVELARIVEKQKIPQDLIKKTLIIK
jgi:hypothetical protein